MNTENTAAQQCSASKFDTAIHNIIEKQTAALPASGNTFSRDAVSAKKAILAQYAEVSDGEMYPLWLCCFSL